VRFSHYCGYLRPSGSWRLAVLAESICGVGTGAALTGNRKYFVFPRANGSPGNSAGGRSGGVVADLTVRYRQYLVGIFVQRET
jgi:hypothetical protein